MERVVHGDFASVVDKERKLRVPMVLANQAAEIAKADAEIDRGIVQLLLGDALVIVACGWEHHLC